MKVNAIKVVNFEKDLSSADIILYNDKNETYMARIQQIDLLIKRIQQGKLLNTRPNYIYVPNTLVVDEIDEDSMFEVVNNLIDEGDFYNVFTKV